MSAVGHRLRRAQFNLSGKTAAQFTSIAVVVFGQFALAQSPVLDSARTDWVLHGLDSSETRFSPLQDINIENVEELGFAWSFEDFVVRGTTNRGVEATPLMIEGVLYFTGPWSVVYAVNARTGALIWEYDPEVDGQIARFACCDAVNRGVAYIDGKIIFGSLGGDLIALDAKNGSVIWRVDTIEDRTRGYTITGAPRLAGDLVLIGNGGGDMGVRGYVSAYKVETGDLAWRFHTVPLRDENFTDAMKLARATWDDASNWAYGGGGTVWDSMVYDADLDQVYIGVGNGSPWPVWRRSPSGGDNLFLSSIVALDAKTGGYLWHYQTTPGDSWDYTATQHIVLAEIEYGESHRKVLIQAPKNGIFYVIDRETGAMVSAEPYTQITWAEGVDANSGRPTVLDSSNYSSDPSRVKPSIAGAHNWQPMSLSKKTGLVYIPVLENDMEIRLLDETPFREGRGSMQAAIVSPAPRPEADPILGDVRSLPWRGVLKAWDPIEQTAGWTSGDLPWTPGGVLSTAGGLVVLGAVDGKLRFYDDQTGALLNVIETGSAIIAPPITYLLDGEQYIAVLAGFGGALRYYTPNSAPLQYENQARLLVFKLGGSSTPRPPERVSPDLADLHSQDSFDRMAVAQGRELFMSHCGRCHTYRGKPSQYPNLWNLPPDRYDALAPIVLEGAMSYAGMPSFAETLTPKDVVAIREFLLADEYRERTK
ncbi:MAG: PQQ-dependent dehydrogenase, methanol/ethanol family [Pseudomonadota bacterium]